jgi:hypothetical protein
VASRARHCYDSIGVFDPIVLFSKTVRTRLGPGSARCTAKGSNYMQEHMGAGAQALITGFRRSHARCLNLWDPLSSHFPHGLCLGKVKARVL